MRQYVIRISQMDPESEDLEFTVLRDDGTGKLKCFIDCLMPGLERARNIIAENYSDEPL